MSTILRPNFPQEQLKNYFSTHEILPKATLLEQNSLTWQDTLEYLRVYWNANDIATLAGLIKKELRIQLLGDSDKIIKAYSYMNTLLWQQVQVIALLDKGNYVQAVLRLKMLDRRMRIWSINIYACFEEIEGKFLLSECELISRRHIRHKSTVAECEALAAVVLKKSIDGLEEKLPSRYFAAERDGDGIGNRVLLKDNLLILSAADKKALSNLWDEIVSLGQIGEIRARYNGDYVIAAEE